MELYWGARAIVKRIGLRDATRLPDIIKQEGLPAFLRRAPGHPRNTYYASESMITSWEIAKGRCYRQTLMAKAEAKAEAGKQR